MTDLSKPRGYCGAQYDQYLDRSDSSTLARMQEQYWATKQAVFRKLGKKEDDCVVASDSELDAKLELFQAIEESCFTLMRVLEVYQDKLCALAQEENTVGRFLKECGKHDKTRAGKMMIATGKTLSYTAQQRLSLRVPLVRLYQEVETFHCRAIADTFGTVEKMEKARTSYRGALMWMKDASQQLDPDMYKQLEKFRKVQGHVKRTKTKFDRFKVDTLQKVDLLAASRCNMFSHVLATYQNTLLQFWEKTTHTMSSVAESFRGYQHYEFCMLKELSETSKKLAEETASQDHHSFAGVEDDKDKLVFFDAEYHDDEDEKISKDQSRGSKENGSQQYLFPSNEKGTVRTESALPNFEGTVPVPEHSDNDVSLLNLEDNRTQTSQVSSLPYTDKAESIRRQDKPKPDWQKDLLTNNPEVDDMDKDDMTLLNELLSDLPPAPSGRSGDDSFSMTWQAAFGNNPTSPQKSYRDVLHSSRSQSHDNSLLNFLPSQLLDHNSSLASAGANDQETVSSSASAQPATTVATSSTATQASNLSNQAGSLASKLAADSSLRKKVSKKQDMSAWYSLFADLDPLANPDTVGKKEGEGDDDRNC